MGAYETPPFNRTRPLVKSAYQKNMFVYFSTKTYVVGIQKNCLNETVLLSTQNICLKLWVRKFYAENFCLSKPMRTFHMQTLETLIRWRNMQHLIWVFNVCICPKEGGLVYIGPCHAEALVMLNIFMYYTPPQFLSC